jgi:uncharacterized protein
MTGLQAPCDGARRADPLQSRAAWLFYKIVDHPRVVFSLTVLCIAAAAVFLPTLHKDTSSTAFIPPDNPALVYYEKVCDLFGHSDPIALAIINEGPNGVFCPETLQLVFWLTEQISQLDAVDPERTTSLATRRNIRGTEDGILMAQFMEEPPQTQEEADAIRAGVMDMPLCLGSLVARDGTATMIVAEPLDRNEGARIYNDILALIESAPKHGETIHVAGEGIVGERLGATIYADALRLNPIGAVVITLMLFVAYRTFRGILLPELVVLFAVLAALGSMAFAGVPYYMITNALPAILIGIAVADSIHIIGQYYEEVARDPGASRRDIVVRTMVEMWRPVTFTSLTDVVGFVSLGATSQMPPMRAFGLYASIGVMAALLLSLFVVPTILKLLPLQQSVAFRPTGGGLAPPIPDRFSLAMGRLGRTIVAHPRLVLALTVGIAVAGFWGTLSLQVNDERISNFNKDEPIYKADRAINRVMDGTNFLEIAVETAEPEGLLEPDCLRRIEALQQYVATLPHATGTVSIVDYLKQMNRAMNENDDQFFTVPDSVELSAQYLLLYSSGGNPADLDRLIDYDYQQARIQITLNSGLYSDVVAVVEDTERYLQTEFNAPGVTGNLAGRANIYYHFMSTLARNHLYGVIVAMLAVLAITSLSFRSLVAGLFTVSSVSLALLAIYAVMGLTGIWLSVGTSMFAAIGIGISVDFAIHTVDRLIVLVHVQRRTLEEAFDEMFHSTGRAMLFNFLCAFSGICVLCTSDLPPLVQFGILLGIAVSFSFVGSITLLPAAILLVRPRFLTPRNTLAPSPPGAQENRVPPSVYDTE